MNKLFLLILIGILALISLSTVSFATTSYTINAIASARGDWGAYDCSYSGGTEGISHNVGTNIYAFFYYNLSGLPAGKNFIKSYSWFKYKYMMASSSHVSGGDLYERIISGTDTNSPNCSCSNWNDFSTDCWDSGAGPHYDTDSTSVFYDSSTGKGEYDGVAHSYDNNYMWNNVSNYTYNVKTNKWFAAYFRLWYNNDYVSGDIYNDNAGGNKPYLMIYLDNPQNTNLVSPSNNTVKSVGDMTQTFNCNASNTENLTNITLYIWNSTGSNIYTNKTNITGVSNSTSWSYTFTQTGTFKWNCKSADATGDSYWSDNGNYTIILPQCDSVDTCCNSSGNFYSANSKGDGCGTCQVCNGTYSQCTNVLNNQDPTADCTDSGYNSCSNTCLRAKSSTDFCNGAGACQTATLNSVANKVCSSGSDVDATTQVLACDSNTNYFCTDGTCSGYYRYSECNGAGTCDTSATTNYQQTNVVANTGYTLDTSCSLTGTTLCGYSGYNACGGSGSPYSCQKQRDMLRCSVTQTCTQDVGDDLANVASGKVCNAGIEVSGSTTYYSSNVTNRCSLPSTPASGFGDVITDVYACDGSGGVSGPDVGDITTDCGTGCCYDAGASASCQSSGTYNIFDYYNFNIYDSIATDYCLNAQVLDCYNDADCLTEKCISNVCTAIPHLKTDLTFTNFTAGHSFNVTAVFNHSNGGTNITSRSISTTSGSCTYISNTTAGNDFTVRYNCTGTALQGTNIQINVTDSGGNKANTTIKSNAYPNNEPTVASATIDNPTPTVLDDLTCLNGTVNDLDSDTVTLLYDWSKNSVFQHINNKVLYHGNLTSGDLWLCKIIPNDGYANGTDKQSGSVSVGTGEVAPYINWTNATTAFTGINSSSAHPTNNDSWVNLSVFFTDPNTEDWTAYFCEDGANSAGCIGATYCVSAINSTSKTLSCRVNATGLASSSYNYNAFVVDNESLVSNQASGTFNINHPPTIPTLIYPSTSVSVPNITVNFTSTDLDGNLINYTIYNSSDNITWGVLFSGNRSYANMTNLVLNSTYYLKASTIDLFGYGLENSSIYSFTYSVDYPIINSIYPSAYSVVTSENLYLYANVTHPKGASYIASDACEFYLRQSGRDFGCGYGVVCPISTTTKSGDVVSMQIGALTVGTLEFQAANCSDTGGNTVSNSSVGINIVISTSGGGGGGGGTVVSQECTSDLDCKVYGSGYSCVANKCVLNQSLLVTEACNYNGICEPELGESWFNCRVDSAYGPGDREHDSGDCSFSPMSLFALGGASSFLFWLTVIAIILAIILFSSGEKKKVVVSKK